MGSFSAFIPTDFVTELLFDVMSLLTLLEAAKYLDSEESGSAVPRGKALFLAIASQSFLSVVYLFT